MDKIMYNPRVVHDRLTANTLSLGASLNGGGAKRRREVETGG